MLITWGGLCSNVVYDVQCIMVIVRLFFLQPKALGCHTTGLISDNFPPVSDGQNKLAYNVWYASAEPSCCWCHMWNSTVMSCRQHICKHNTTKLVFLLWRHCPVLPLCCFVANDRVKWEFWFFSVFCFGLSMLAPLGQRNIFTDNVFPFTKKTQIAPEILVLGLRPAV